MQWAEAEIENGGLSQFWENDTGVFGPDLVAAARPVGANVLAGIYADAAALFPG